MNMFFAQASVTTQPAGGGTSAAAPQPQPQGGGFGMLVPMLLIFALFYFMMIRPQQRKEKERRKMIDELRAGAKVLFAGGLTGTIVEAKDKTFRIEIADGVVIEVARAAVQSVIVEETPAAQ
ncbi:MAG: preprotein translocase subunit YajC [Kiritimatiellia bacterium]